jgi:hypothetical protein
MKNVLNFMAQRKELGVDKDRMGDIVILDFPNGRDLYVDLSVVSTVATERENSPDKYIIPNPNPKP